MCKSKVEKVRQRIKNFVEDEAVIKAIYSITYVCLLILFSNTSFLGDVSVRDADVYDAFFRNQGILTTLLANVGIVFLMGWDYIPQKNGVVRVWDMIWLLVLMVLAIFVYAHAHHQLEPVMARREFLEAQSLGPCMYCMFVVGLIIVKNHLMQRTIPGVAYSV